MKQMIILKSAVIGLLLTLACTRMSAQQIRSTYFIDGNQTRLQLNPAAIPNQGFINVPVIGGVSTTMASNTFGTGDISDIIANRSDADYFMNDKFIRKLNMNNKFNASVNTDFVSAGWFSGEGFWNANVSLKLDLGVSVPRNIFEFMRDTRGMNLESWFDYSSEIHGEKLDINSYMETGVGYARPINNRLTLGGKVKMLFGIGNVRMRIDKLGIKTKLTGIDPHKDWREITRQEIENAQGVASIETDASIEASMKGFGLVESNRGYVNKIKRSGSLGIAGMGMGIDLGATYKITNQFTVSGAVLDLGFISWSKDNSHRASSNASREYSFNIHDYADAIEFSERLADGKVLDVAMLNIIKRKEKKARTTSLYTSLVLGGEYKLLDDKLTLGLLSTTRFAQPNTIAELTLGTAYKLTPMISFSLSYSMIQSRGAGLGLGVQLGPIVIATDYLYFGNNTRCLNAMVGMSIPLGTRRK